MKTSTHRNSDVERYIHELAIALAGLPVEEREDVIAGVREHIDASLADIAEPAEADVARVLESLGDPLAIAADAGAPSAAADPADRASGPDHAVERPLPGQRDTSEAPSRGQSGENGELLRSHWVPPAAMLTLAAGPLMLIVSGPGTIPIAGVVWMAGFILLVASPLWRTWEVVASTAAMVAVPALWIGFGGGTTGELWLRGPLRRILDPYGYPTLITFLSMAALAAALVAALLTWAWLWKRGASRVSRRPAQG